MKTTYILPASTILVALVVATLVAVTSPALVLAKKHSSEYQSGYRAGVRHADSDINSNRDVDANHVICPPYASKPDSCSGYKKGYSDEAVDQLD
jgi:hypothetical protein